MELIPGVQEGQRLTLTGVSDRIGRVEEIVAKLAEDFYGPAQPSVLVSRGDFGDGSPVILDGETGQRATDETITRILEMKDARIAELEIIELNLRGELRNKELKLGEVQADNDYWHQEFIEAQDELEKLRSRIAGLI